MKTLSAPILAAAAALAAAVPSAADPAPETAAGRLLANAPRVAAAILRDMPLVHVRHRGFEGPLAAAAWTNFVDSLDYEHVYFTQEDVDAFAPAGRNYDALLRAGDSTWAKSVFERFVQRVAERRDFVAAAVSNDFDFAEADSYVFRRHREPRPADAAAQDALWTQRVKNALLAARIRAELANENASNRLARAAAEGAAEDGATNAFKSVEAAVAEAREDIVKAQDRFLALLRDSDEEYWLGRFFNAVATAYDPHSAYLSPAGAEDFNIDMGLSLQGIGATLQSEDGACKIVEIVPGSPSDRDSSPERLVPGDKIIAVAQGDEPFVDVRHWPLYKAVRLIRGPKGSTVRLRVIPASDPNAEKTVTLVRDEIKLEEQAASGQVETFEDAAGAERRMGYVKLPGFYATPGGPGTTRRSCSDDIAKILADFNSQGVEGLVLDLRGNGGGSLQEAVFVAGLFLRTGPVVMVRETRRKAVLPDNNPAVAFRGPMVVLVDRLSASASEIVAAALQDYGRAVVLGDRSTHGKGTVQSVMPVEGNEKELGTLKATTALFYRITGASTQLRGVSADIRLPSFFEAYAELGEDKLPGALKWSHVSPAIYRTVDDFDAVLPELRARSEARRAADPRWKARTELLANFAAFNTNNLVSLRYAERRAQAAEDDRVARAVAEASGAEDDAPDMTGAGGDLRTGDEDGADADGAVPDAAERRRLRKEKARKADIVLDEALRVLADLADLHGAPPALAAGGGAGSVRGADDFLRSLLLP
ncbi:MAG: carboxy terminal-processing peptidase [Kiritimatiellae bacterium]|nr:carboxy terminal-processing peptidase [Kiritimatiellia bacterium]